ncbi:hypothetical protein PIB30_039085 [Stylosanthes scabra]|uniref:Uncharacterized protein n=1 Tax=Stylosanthes scabra TaxID=79078 RepID=A0ABU6XBY9_9FABA|nr:hypothetical protein [Stylosanthes scabra]
MGMSYSSVNFRDELVSSSEGEDVLGQERYSSASTRTQEMYFNSSRNGGEWTYKATPTLKACAELFLEPWRRRALHNLCSGESLLGRLIGLYSDRTNVGQSLYRPDHSPKLDLG